MMVRLPLPTLYYTSIIQMETGYMLPRVEKLAGPNATDIYVGGLRLARMENIFF